MIRIGLVLAAFGFLAGFMGWREARLASVADAEPQELTFRQLSDEGYGDNAHVIVTQFGVSRHDYVYMEGRRNSSRWARVWLPLRPETRTREWQQPRFEVVLRSSAMPNDSAVYDFDQESRQTQRVQGLIVNAAESLQGEERELLRSIYPYMDIDDVLILDHNRSPASTVKVLFFWFVAAALFVPGVGLIVRRRMRKPEKPRGAAETKGKSRASVHR